MAVVVGEDDVDGGEISSRDSSAGAGLTRQQRFEGSNVGKMWISGLVVAVLLFNVSWNLPISPISRGLQQVVAPFAAPLGLDQWWGVFAPPDTRVVLLEVDVAMAGGETRVWHMQPGAPGVGWWARWMLLSRRALTDPNVRPQFAHWVVGEVVKAGERAVGVSVVLRSENLPKPGDAAGGKAPASKVLYQETLGAGQ